MFALGSSRRICLIVDWHKCVVFGVIAKDKLHANCVNYVSICMHDILT